MTPKEKAWKLYHKFRTLEGKFGDKVLYNYDAKQCALITVDEMIMQNGDIYLNSFVSDVITFYKQKNAYLFEVKQEIEKI